MVLSNISQFVRFFEHSSERRHNTITAIHSATTFKDIQLVLEEAERGQWSILQTVFGAVPYWRAPTSESSHIGANCQTLYAVDSSEYVLAVVRGPHSDYPIALGE
jgi:hypothetical protein